MPIADAGRRARSRWQPRELAFGELYAADGTLGHGQVHPSPSHGRVRDEGLHETAELCHLAQDQV